MPRCYPWSLPFPDLLGQQTPFALQKVVSSSETVGMLCVGVSIVWSKLALGNNVLAAVRSHTLSKCTIVRVETIASNCYIYYEQATSKQASNKQALLLSALAITPSQRYGLYSTLASLVQPPIVQKYGFGSPPPPPPKP